MAEVYTTDERPRDTVVVDRDHDDRRGISTGAIVALIIVGLILLFLLFGGFGSGGGGGGGANVSAPTSTSGQ